VGDSSRFGRRLRGAARPSLGVALTTIGAVIAVVAVISNHGRQSPQGHPAKVCRSVSARTTIRRTASSRQWVTRRRPISATERVTASEQALDGSASVTVVAAGSATEPARASACAFDRDRSEAGYRAGVEAKRRATAKARRVAAPKAARRAHRNAIARARRRAVAGAEARLDKAALQQQPRIEEEARSNAMEHARAAARARAATAATSP